MERNILLAGVGGQGILTIAKAISAAAARRGWSIKQAEVHGMSQRGGAVQSHLRISDGELFSDLIAAGKADLIVSAEPLESLRYIHMLRPSGVLATSACAFVNIPNYPPIEDVLERVALHPNHLIVDADRLARAAGSGRSGNIVVLGASSLDLPFDPEELEEAVAEMFAAKGAQVVEVSRRAFRFGRNAAAAYRAGLMRGATSRAVRHWVETLDESQLAAAERPDAPVLDVLEPVDRLSGAETHAVERVFETVYQENRRRLFEHEVYQIIHLVGAIDPPHHVFVPTHEVISAETLERFPGERVVLKVVSPDIVHKSDADAIAFCAKSVDVVNREMTRLLRRHEASARVEGILVVEFVHREHQSLGSELFVGIRATREFGPIIAAGLGGVDTEYLARTLRPGLAVAKAIATDITPEEFLELFRRTAAYDMLAGNVRGHRRSVSDAELLRCFRAFISLAVHFCVDRADAGPDLGELEVNPFAFRNQRLIPLDGRARLQTAVRRPTSRPLDNLRRLLEPSRIGIVGVSTTSRNFGRIILDNTLECGFDPDRIRIIREGQAEIGGVRCVASIRDLDEPVDLLVVATGADQLPSLVRECVESKRVHSAILIPGGAGETEGGCQLERSVRAAIADGRSSRPDAPVFVGPNCLGVLSRPGRYDTLFIPANKLAKRREAPGSGVALISQSGAFMITQLSNIETLDPTISISLGNQVDITLSDTLRVVGERSDVHTIGVYVEGFNDLDGLDLLQTIRDLTEAGTTVIFYKAGRTPQGRDAAAGHTAAVAGDYDICEAGAEAAGALVADTFTDFQNLLQVAAATHDRIARGVRLGAVTNAGFESVGMADAVSGPRHSAEFAALDDEARDAIKAVLQSNRLAGLVNVRNPLDLTPMASESAYEGAARAMLACPSVDALIISCIPLTPAMATTADELGGHPSLADTMTRLRATTDKPIVAVLDAGTRYAELAARIRAAGVPVLNRADEAVRSLARIAAHRAAHPARTAAAVSH